MFSVLPAPDSPLRRRKTRHKLAKNRDVVCSREWVSSIDSKGGGCYMGVLQVGVAQEGGAMVAATENLSNTWGLIRAVT